MTIDSARAKSIFLAASELLDPAQRAEYLAQQCGSDAELRARVEALLRAEETAVDLGDERPGSAVEPIFDVPTVAQPDTMIAGRYKLRQQIGEGGMGTVWMADQTEPVKRKVAVKLIRVERGESRTILARFEAERQAIAMMDHPHIAKLLDAGTTETGAPFFVMELVKGIPLNVFCDQHKLTIAERLSLFVQICGAVQHAHQKGIIHRDLKPTNILVESHDGKPVPKVIDFGLAKATTGLQLTENSMFTAFGSVLGTPLYMAPEQANFNAVDVDTRADVYALGVILYELLTGTTPLTRDTLKKAALDEMLKLIREQDAPTPSSRLSSVEALPSISANRQTEPQKLGRFVKGELDWIVLKALSKDRNRRYETANGFARDVERFLNHEPVTAGPPSASYRFQKFVQRNRGQVIAASLVLLALVAGVVGTTVGLLEAMRQTAFARQQETLAKEQTALARKEAEAKELAWTEEARQRGLADIERKKAIEFRDKALDALRATTSEDVEKLLGEKQDLTANEKAYLEAIAKRWLTFAGLEGADEPSRAIAAEGHHLVAYLWQKLGRREEARPEYERAIAIRKQLAAEFPAAPKHRHDLAISHSNLGHLLQGLGQAVEADKQYRQSLAIKQKLIDDFPDVPQHQFDLGRSHDNFGIVLAGLGQRVEAEEQFRKGLALRNKLAAEFPDVPEYRRELSSSHNNLGLLLQDLGRQVESEEQYQHAVAIEEQLAAEFPNVPEYRLELARTQCNFGRLLAALGRSEEAEEQYLQGLAIQKQLAAEFPSVPEYRFDLARSHNNFGQLLAGLGLHEKAEQQYLRGLSLQERLFADFPNVPGYGRDLAGSHSNLGRLLSGVGQLSAAEEQHYKGLEIREKLAADFPNVPDYRSDLALSHNSLGLLLARQGQFAEAEEHYRQGVAIQEKLATDFASVAFYKVELGGSYCNFGNTILSSGRPTDSLEWFDKANKTLRPVYEAEPRYVNAKIFLRNSHWARANTYDTLGRHAEAVKDWDQAIELSPNEEQPGFRAIRASSRLRAGQVDEAVADVAELKDSPSWSANHWYDFACVYAVASSKIADKKTEYADQAMELLAKAVQSGWKDAEFIKKDTDLDPLRDRDDFKQLIAELESK